MGRGRTGGRDGGGYGVWLTALGTGTQEGVRITLDCAQAAFISYDKMVISLKGGEMCVSVPSVSPVPSDPAPQPRPQLNAPLPPGSYVLTLITDGMRSVRAFHFDKAAASVLTTSVS